MKNSPFLHVDFERLLSMSMEMIDKVNKTISDVFGYDINVSVTGLETTASAVVDVGSRIVMKEPRVDVTYLGNIDGIDHLACLGSFTVSLRTGDQGETVYTADTLSRAVAEADVIKSVRDRLRHFEQSGVIRVDSVLASSDVRQVHCSFIDEEAWNEDPVAVFPALMVSPVRYGGDPVLIGYIPISGELVLWGIDEGSRILQALYNYRVFWNVNSITIRVGKGVEELNAQEQEHLADVLYFDVRVRSLGTDGVAACFFGLVMSEILGLSANQSIENANDVVDVVREITPSA